MENLLNKKVWFVRSANINTRQMSPVEVGVVTREIPGWYVPHYRVEPLKGQPATSVPEDRIWIHGLESSKEEIINFISSFKKEQERSVRLMKEKLEASVYKLHELENILKDFTEDT